jgi:hypothetical protein
VENFKFIHRSLSPFYNFRVSLLLISSGLLPLDPARKQGGLYPACEPVKQGFAFAL